jgi:hypothetical protein
MPSICLKRHTASDRFQLFFFLHVARFFCFTFTRVGFVVVVGHDLPSCRAMCRSPPFLDLLNSNYWATLLPKHGITYDDSPAI